MAGLWEAIRSLTGRHRQYASTDRALPRADGIFGNYNVGCLLGAVGAHLGGAVTGMSASVHAAALMCHVVFIDARGAEHIVALEQARTVAFEDGRMVRKIPSYRGQKHAPGRYWSASTVNWSSMRAIWSAGG